MNIRRLFGQKHSLSQIIGLSLALVLLPFAAASTTAEDRPAAPSLLPRDTLLYLRLHDARDFVEQFNEAAIGKMMADEQVKPLVTELYGAAASAFKEAEDELGVSLSELLSIPDGEVCIAVIAPDEGRPVVNVIFDIGEDNLPAMTLIERGETALRDGGSNRETEMYQDVEIKTYKRQNRREAMSFFQREGTMILSSNIDSAKQMIDVWDGRVEDFGSLADNRKFTSIMKKCAGKKDERPQFTWFVDPIQFAKTAARGNGFAQTGLALLPALGLDGLEGAGGSMILNTEEFDMIGHAHLLLDNPRSGVLELLAFSTGDLEPERWVPHDIMNYATAHWDIEKTYTEFAKLYDSFRGEDALSNEVRRRISDEIEIDFEGEIIPAFDGRVTYLSWFARPVKLNSQSHLVALKLRDEAIFRETFRKLTTKYGENLNEQAYGGVKYYTGNRPERPRRENANEGDEDGRPRRRGPDQRIARRPSPCLAIVEGYLMMCDNAELLHKVIEARGSSRTALKNELDFKLISSKINEAAGDVKPSMIFFERPDESFRWMIDMANSADTRNVLREQSEDNPFWQSIQSALDNNPMPEFSALQKYLSPSGGSVIDDETGVHYTVFGLKREIE